MGQHAEKWCSSLQLCETPQGEAKERYPGSSQMTLDKGPHRLLKCAHCVSGSHCCPWMCSQWSWCSPESNSAHPGVGSWCLHGWVTPQAPSVALTEGPCCRKTLTYPAFRQVPARTNVFLYSWTDFHPRQHWLFSRVNGWVQTTGKMSAMGSKWK